MCPLLEVAVETEHEVVAVEVKTPVLGSAVMLCGAVATLIAEEADMCHKTEFFVEVQSHAGTQTDAIFHSCVTVSATDAEINTAVYEKVNTLSLEICVTCVRINLEHCLLFVT